MIKLQDNELCLIEFNSLVNKFINMEEWCEPYCDPNCNPTCTPVCSPSCNPCYPLHHCNPESFYCAPECDDDD